jgi:hypothetical protein
MTDFYRRERLVRIHRLSPSRYVPWPWLEPDAAHTIVIRDTQDNQPIFGFFSGGGWAFGYTENSNARILPASYDAYAAAVATPTTPFPEIVVAWTNGHTETLRVGIDIPFPENLRRLDQLAFNHDWTLAIAERVTRWIQPMSATA